MSSHHESTLILWSGFTPNVNASERCQLVEQHIRGFFSGHAITDHQWALGPLPDAIPEFRVLCIAPGIRTECWTYCSVGASTIAHDDAGLLEFFILSPAEDLRHVELVTMTAWYHKTKTLGLGHTFPIGEPWLDNSRCDHMLVSLPYPFGPDLEICNFENGHIHVLWLLPITKSERDFKAANGLEALEQTFEREGLEYWDASRKAVV